ncbi:hypothetical protein [Chitinophaga sp. Cy-1792]|uniref:hypothetical protein n=1 Tax=Chitinophaga sp. Cy-1792 TaxID=2608339 RepID=UPI00141E9A14|nr:hypothetical protein [Chitinophaga sp. Cy-1792]NIG55393.1 hypothetical protein [Chitinophaga sp. Cy-1792]
MKIAEILEWIDLIERRPLMVLSDSTVVSLKSYMDGFVDGLGMALKVPKLRLSITFWYQQKINLQSDMHWINQILHVNEGKPEAEIKSVILNALRDYFIENPDGYFGAD